MRIEPPLSEPKATSAVSVATATAEPLEEPPGTRAGLRGLTGVPKNSLIPEPPYASSTRFALPTNRAPAVLAPAMQAASETAILASSATARHPAVVGTPDTSMRSLTASKGPLPGPGSIGVMKIDIALSHGLEDAERVPDSKLLFTAQEQTGFREARPEEGRHGEVNR